MMRELCYSAGTSNL